MALVGTLERRYKGKCDSAEEANQNYRQKLNDVQDDTLPYKDELTKRHSPPINVIIKNLADEIIHESVDKNWAGDFVKRHSERICSVYLSRIDNNRSYAESPVMLEQFYIFVLFDLLCSGSSANF